MDSIIFASRPGFFSMGVADEYDRLTLSCLGTIGLSRLAIPEQCFNNLVPIQGIDTCCVPQDHIVEERTILLPCLVLCSRISKSVEG